MIIISNKLTDIRIVHYYQSIIQTQIIIAIKNNLTIIV